MPAPIRPASTRAKVEAFPSIASKIDGQVPRQLLHRWQRIGIGLAPKGRSSRRKMFTVTGPMQALLQIARITRGLMQPAQLPP